MNKILNFLDIRKYQFSEEDEEQFLATDIKKLRSTHCSIIIISIICLILVNVNPDLLDDAGGYIKYYSLGLLLLSGIGAIFTNIKVKEKKTQRLIQKANIMYMEIIFVFVTIIPFIYSPQKGVGLVMYFLFLLFNVNVVHINPICFTVAVIGTLIFFFINIEKYLGSYTLFSHIVIVSSTLIYLSFEINNNIRNNLHQITTISLLNKALGEQVDEKTQQVIDSSEKQAMMQEKIIFAMADLVESRDADTGDHVKRTSFYVKIIADNLCKRTEYKDILTDNFVKLMEKAAPMHDIGKIMMPDEILKAPRRLTTEEFEKMKTHTIEGGKIVNHVYAGIESDEYIKCATNIAMYHHERWNGKGYPYGLKGEEIPIEARIMAVADVFDALVSKRCYKDEFPLEDAFKIIKDESNEQFDKNMVDAFLSSENEIIEYLTKE